MRRHQYMYYYRSISLGLVMSRISCVWLSRLRTLQDMSTAVESVTKKHLTGQGTEDAMSSTVLNHLDTQN